MAVKPAATGRLLKAGIAVLIAGALLLLLGAVGAFYFWNNNEKHVRAIFYLFNYLHCKAKYVCVCVCVEGGGLIFLLAGVTAVLFLQSWGAS